MQKTTKLLMAIGTSSMFLSTPLFASLTTTLDLAPSGYRDPNSVGGEFTAVVSGGANYVANYNSAATAQVSVGGNTVTGFETFCIEMNEEFNPGDTYNTSVGNTIVPGGPYNYVTVGTAYLYSQFAQGTLAGYTYTSGAGRELVADELQDAIWYLQGEVGASGSSQTSDSLYTFSAASDPFVNMVQTMFGSNATESDITYDNSFGVEVLNLSSGSGYNATYNQDQLVYAPTPAPTPVPEPATFAAGAMLLLPLGVSAVRILRRKHQ
jgi:hypothetical protein